MFDSSSRLVLSCSTRGKLKSYKRDKRHSQTVRCRGMFEQWELTTVRSAVQAKHTENGSLCSTHGTMYVVTCLFT